MCAVGAGFGLHSLRLGVGPGLSLLHVDLGPRLDKLLLVHAIGGRLGGSHAPAIVGWRPLDFIHSLHAVSFDPCDAVFY